MPKDWDPMTDFKKLDFSKLKDSDPRAQEALQNLREAWNKAPIEPSMDGARIRIPGFIVPLEVAQHQITEFLLVPYFGAYIHVPPPPANQIIHVFPAKPLKKGLQSMDAVWISGMLETVAFRYRHGKRQLPDESGSGRGLQELTLDTNDRAHAPLFIPAAHLGPAVRAAGRGGACLASCAGGFTHQQDRQACATFPCLPEMR